MLEKLACNQGRNDEELNIQLAIELCEKDDKTGIAELIGGLETSKTIEVNDCIKVLYEVGERKPELIEDYVEEFLSFLRSKNNRLVWGSMTALATIADRKPDSIYQYLDWVLGAMKNGSVITVDNSMTVLAKVIKAKPEYTNVIFPILMEHLEHCRPKEVPQHAERISVCIKPQTLPTFLDVLKKREEHLTESQKKRLTRLKKQLAQKLIQE